MREILHEIRHWSGPFALATVVGTWGSSPRQPGAAMAVNADGAVAGSVSGGCVEGAVYEVCQEVMRTHKPVLVRYGVSDDEAFAVGLTCGGVLDVFVQRVNPAVPGPLAEVIAAVDGNRAAALATVIDTDTETAMGEEVAVQDADGSSGGHLPDALVGRQVLLVEGERRGSAGDERLDDAIVTAAEGLLEHGRNGLVRVGSHGERRLDEVTVFVESFAPAPRMIIFGAIDFAAAMAKMGAFLGYHVTVCDARSTFATRSRFPDVDELVVRWPHDYLGSIDIDSRTVLCVLTHDPKFDVPLLQEALRTPAAYIGVMGSRRTHDDRNRRLRERGVSDADLARLSSPVGLDLGSRTPEETAVSIAAEIIANRWGGTGQRLSGLDSPIHRDQPHSAEVRHLPNARIG